MIGARKAVKKSLLRGLTHPRAVRKALPSLPPYLKDTRATAGAAVTSSFAARWDLLYLINNTAGLTDVPIYGISGQTFNASLAPAVCVQAQQDAVAEWTISNPIWICNASQPLCLSTMNRSAASGPLLNKYERPITLSHGFHMHTFKFQVVDDSNGGASVDYHVGDWRDTVTTPVAGWGVPRLPPSAVAPGICNIVIGSKILMDI